MPKKRIVTHEPAQPQNWPDGHVDFELTGDDQGECFIVTIHDVEHYLHATTAYELFKKMQKIIPEWDAEAKKYGWPGVLD